MSFQTFVYKQKITSWYSMKSPLFPLDCRKTPPLWAMPWSAPETFYFIMIHGGHSETPAGPSHFLYDLLSICPHQYDEVRKHLREMFEIGAIRKSNSPWASPMVLVHKKDGSL